MDSHPWFVIFDILCIGGELVLPYNPIPIKFELSKKKSSWCRGGKTRNMRDSNIE